MTELANSQHSNVEQVAKEVSGDLQTVATSGADNIEKGTIGKNSCSDAILCRSDVSHVLLYNITVGAKSVVTEQRTETLARLFSTPTSSFSILFGKF